MDIKLETHDRLLVGWTHVQLAEPPAIVAWGMRLFRYRGAFTRGQAAEPGDLSFWVYSEEVPFVLLAERLDAKRPEPRP